MSIPFSSIVILSVSNTEAHISWIAGADFEICISVSSEAILFKKARLCSFYCLNVVNLFALAYESNFFEMVYRSSL